ncbi:hypothetical protein [Agromyces silvae]|uniref:hypothetical protein n=1 Tax=Agromyces silvae TaxID=3388266 RepID=UPI00280BB782|nr:hypothetical protein [Agromyces protaetiae]
MNVTARRSTRRTAVLGPAAVLLAGCLAGCVAFPPTVCPAVGYVSGVGVVVEGVAAGSGLDLELCTEAGCVSTATDAPLSADGPMIAIAGGGEGRWYATFHGDTPETMTAEVFDEAGASLGEARAELVWHRIGGSEQCGGPQEAEPIVVRTD